MMQSEEIYGLPTESLGCWLRLLRAARRITHADLFRLRMLLMRWSGAQSAVASDRQHPAWSWPTAGEELRVALLLSLLFVSLREGSVRLRFSPEALQPLCHRVLKESLAELEAESREHHNFGVAQERVASAQRVLKICAFPVSESELPTAALAEKRMKEQLELLLVGWSAESLRPLAARLPLVVRDESLYFHRYDSAEQLLVDRLGERLTAAPRFDRSEVETLFDRLETGSFELHEMQREAVIECCRRPTAVVTGGPGTGKTSVVAQILRLLFRLEPDLRAEEIALVAPTGRAAARLHESLRLALSTLRSEESEQQEERLLLAAEGMTIHRLLSYDPIAGTFRFHRKNLLAHRLVVVDESSMVDLHLFAALLESLPEGSRLILLGDSHQLPPVDAGAVLGDLGAVSVCLTHSFRSVKEILELAEEINRGDGVAAARRMEAQRLPLDATQEIWNSAQSEPLIALDAEGDWLRAWGERFYGDSYADLLRRWSSAAKKDPPRIISEEESALYPLCRELFQTMHAGRILALTRGGSRGVEAINQALEEFCIERGYGRSRDALHGQPAMVLRNDTVRQLYNGDTGILLRQGEQFSLLVERSGRRFELVPQHAVAKWESAFAITIHKSQGSEYGEVLLVLPETNHRLLTRELLYTGVTRAKRRVTLLGELSLFAFGCERKMEREGGLREQLVSRLSDSRSTVV